MVVYWPDLPMSTTTVCVEDYSLVTCSNSLLFFYFLWIQVTCFWSLVSIIIQCSWRSGKAEIDEWRF